MNYKEMTELLNMFGFSRKFTSPSNRYYWVLYKNYAFMDVRKNLLSIDLSTVYFTPMVSKKNSNETIPISSIPINQFTEMLNDFILDCKRKDIQDNIRKINKDFI